MVVGVVEGPAAEGDLIWHGEDRARSDQSLLESTRDRHELHDRARLVDRGDRQVLSRGNHVAIRLGDEIDHGEDPARSPVLDDRHATGGVSGFDLPGKIRRDLELERLVQTEHEARALARCDDVCGGAGEALTVGTGRHDL